MNSKKWLILLPSLLIILLASSVGITRSSFVDLESSTGNTFQAWSSTQWLQTTKADFDAGVLTNVDTSSSPGNVILAAKSGWYNTSWQYRRAITLSAATSVSNYQVLVTLTTAIMGSPYAHVKSDGSDIRFTGPDGITLQDYWIESWSNSGTSKIWVEVATSGTSTIYLYFGNSSATSASNGTATFEFFDDFEDGIISSSYTRIGYNGWSEANGILTFTTGGTTGYDPNVLKIDNKTYGWGYEIRGKIRVRQWQDHDMSRMGLGLRTRAADGDGYKGLFHWRSGTGRTRAVLHDLVAWILESASPWSLNTWYWIGFYARLDGTTRYLYEKDWLVGSNEPGWILTPSSTSTANQDGQPCIAGSSIPAGGFTTQFIGDWDDVFVKKCVYPEPTTSVGSEEGMYVLSGTIASQVLDTGVAGARWNALFWDETLDTGTDITFAVRASNTPFAKDAATPSWTNLGSVNSPITSGLPSGQYKQWRATLTTTDTGRTPTLREVRVYYY